MRTELDAARADEGVDLAALADRRLYEAKRAGRDRIVSRSASAAR